MEDSATITDVRNETFRKLGRNVVAVQKMEAMLKFLIANHRIEGRMDQALEIQKKRMRSVERKTLGGLVDSLFETVYSQKSDDGPDQVASEGTFSMKTTVESDEAEVDQYKKELAVLVKQRNSLIHQMAAKLDLDSIESCHALSNALDDQRMEYRRHYANLQSLVTAFVDGHKEAIEWMRSECSQVPAPDMKNKS